jgi:hypothetical protein
VKSGMLAVKAGWVVRFGRIPKLTPTDNIPAKRFTVKGGTWLTCSGGSGGKKVEHLGGRK